MLSAFRRSGNSRMLALASGGVWQYLGDAFVFFYFMSFTFYLVTQREFPYLYDDEYGVLGAAAVLAGYDWTAPAGMPFYGFGLSLLIAPLYKLGLEPTPLYRAALSVNGLMVAASAILAMRTLRQLELPILGSIRIGIVVAAFSYPAVLFYAGLAMGESVLLFCLMLIIYSLVSIVGREQKQYVMPILLGLGLGLAPYAHTRGLVFWLVAVPIIVLAIRARWLTLKTVAVALAAAALVAAGLAGIKSWILVHFYSELRAGTGSAGDFMASRATLLTPEHLIVIARVAFGQFTYLATSTFGLVLAGIVACFTGAWPLLAAQTQLGAATDLRGQRQAIAAGLVAMATSLMFTLSVAQMGMPVRADHFFYGRYNEVVLPPVLVAALVLFFVVSESGRRVGVLWLTAAIAVSVLLMFGVSLFPAELFERNMFWNPISGWFVHIHGPWKIEPVRIAVGTLIGGLILVVAFALSRRLFLFGVGIMFVTAALHNYAVQHKGGDEAWSWYGKLNTFYGKPFTGKLLALVDAEGRSRIGSEALQFALPNALVKFDTSELGSLDVIFDRTWSYCNEENTIGRVGPTVLCVLDENLRRKIEKFAVPELLRLSARDLAPASIQIDEERVLLLDGMWRLCAKAEKYFYTKWARYCLPSITVKVERSGVTGLESQKLGLFIIDEAKRWRGEMRHELDGEVLRRDGVVTVRVPLRLLSNLGPGVYTVNAAIFDEKGWDWRAVASTKLMIE